MTQSSSKDNAEQFNNTGAISGFMVGEKMVFVERPCLRGSNSPEHQVLEMLPGMNTLTYFPAVLC